MRVSVIANTVISLSSGATFFRGDLHIHSYGGSYDVTDSNATPQAIVATAKAEGLAFIAVAEHNEICNIQLAVSAGAADDLLVIPGVELSTPEGHLLCYTPTVDALERFFNRLQIADRRTPKCRCQTGALQCLELLEAEGGFAILAHVELGGAFQSNIPLFTPPNPHILSHPPPHRIHSPRPPSPRPYTLDP